LKYIFKKSLNQKISKGVFNKLLLGKKLKIILFNFNILIDAYMSDNSNDNDGWTVVGSRNKPRKPKAKPKPTPPSNNNNSTSNHRRRPTGPVSASFNQGSHFPAFNPNEARENQQDWGDVTFQKRNYGSKNRGEGPTRTERRYGRSAEESRHLHKIEDETESFHHKKVSRDLSQKIINFRASHHLTQKQLAARMSLPLSTVQGYERGSAIPVGRITNKFHQILSHGV